MIQNKKHLRFYLQADMMMNRGFFKTPFKIWLQNLLSPDYTMKFLKTMRKVQYYSHCNVTGGIFLIINKIIFFRLSRKLGFSIGFDACDYGLVIPHHGTIVVGNTNRIGPYAVLHTSTCITDTCRKIGKGLSLSTGAKITGGEVLGDHITIAANSVVTRSFPDGNALLVGIPAFLKRGDIQIGIQALQGKRSEE